MEQAGAAETPAAMPDGEPQTQAEKEAIERRGRAYMRIIPTADATPPWVKFPGGLQVPVGRRLIFVRFASRLTAAPHKGVALEFEDAGAIKLAGKGGLWRQAILWELSVTDETLAINRSMQDRLRYQRELTKQMVRVIDGHVVDRSGNPGPGNPDVFWEEIGEKYRNLMNEIWQKAHRLTDLEQVDFFEHCIALNTSAG